MRRTEKDTRECSPVRIRGTPRQKVSVTRISSSSTLLLQCQKPTGSITFRQMGLKSASLEWPPTVLVLYFEPHSQYICSWFLFFLKFCPLVLEQFWDSGPNWEKSPFDTSEAERNQARALPGISAFPSPSAGSPEAWAPITDRSSSHSALGNGVPHTMTPASSCLFLLWWDLNKDYSGPLTQIN